MKVPENVVEGIFVRRVNRFLAEVRIGKNVTAVHVPHSGRLGELFFRGNRALLLPAKDPKRKTRYNLLLVGKPKGQGWVCVDSRNPNHLVKEAVEKRTLPGFENYSIAIPEPSIPGGRIDFRLEGNGVPPCFTEIKCVTLVQGDVALFPDAPTLRGTKHLRYLTERAREGAQVAILFVVTRSDAKTFSTNDENDPKFGQALKAAIAHGAIVKALTCKITRKEIQLLNSIPIYKERSNA